VAAPADGPSPRGGPAAPTCRRLRLRTPLRRKVRAPFVPPLASLAGDRVDDGGASAMRHTVAGRSPPPEPSPALPRIDYGKYQPASLSTEYLRYAVSTGGVLTMLPPAPPPPPPSLARVLGADAAAAFTHMAATPLAIPASGVGQSRHDPGIGGGTAGGGASARPFAPPPRRVIPTHAQKMELVAAFAALPAPPPAATAARAAKMRAALEGAATEAAARLVAARAGAVGVSLLPPSGDDDDGGQRWRGGRRPTAAMSAVAEAEEELGDLRAAAAKAAAKEAAGASAAAVGVERRLLLEAVFWETEADAAGLGVPPLLAAALNRRSAAAAAVADVRAAFVDQKAGLSHLYAAEVAVRSILENLEAAAGAAPSTLDDGSGDDEPRDVAVAGAAGGSGGKAGLPPSGVDLFPTNSAGGSWGAGLGAFCGGILGVGSVSTPAGGASVPLGVVSVPAAHGGESVSRSFRLRYVRRLYPLAEEAFAAAIRFAPLTPLTSAALSTAHFAAPTARTSALGVRIHHAGWSGGGRGGGTNGGGVTTNGGGGGGGGSLGSRNAPARVLPVRSAADLGSSAAPLLPAIGGREWSAAGRRGGRKLGPLYNSVAAVYRRLASSYDWQARLVSTIRKDAVAAGAELEAAEAALEALWERLMEQLML